MNPRDAEILEAVLCCCEGVHKLSYNFGWILVTLLRYLLLSQRPKIIVVIPPMQEEFYMTFAERDVVMDALKQCHAKGDSQGEHFVLSTTDTIEAHIQLMGCTSCNLFDNNRRPCMRHIFTVPIYGFLRYLCGLCQTLS